MGGVKDSATRCEGWQSCLTEHQGTFINDGNLTLLHKNHTTKANYSYHEWSEDGNRIYYPSTYQAEFHRIRFRDLITGIDSVLVVNLNWRTSSVNESPDGQWLVFNADEEGVKVLYYYHIATGKLEKFTGIPFASVESYTQFDPNENAVVAFLVKYPTLESDIVSFNLETKEFVKWTNNKVESDYSNPEIIRYSTFDIDSLTGETRQISSVYYQPNLVSQKAYPVIIWIHGGPLGQSKPQLDPRIKSYLDKGIAILKPNVRGSMGYGFSFRNLDNGKLREDAVKDIGMLLEWIKSNTDLDADKVVVRGESYGGYMSLACAVHYSDRLLGAIDYYGMTEFESFLEGEDRNADRSNEYGDINDPEMRSFYKVISPVNNVDKISIPIFIYQGEQDARVLVSQSRRMVETLRVHNKPYWYLEAKNEGHFAKHSWNMVYTTAAEFEFVDRLLEETK